MFQYFGQVIWISSVHKSINSKAKEICHYASRDGVDNTPQCIVLNGRAVMNPSMTKAEALRILQEEGNGGYIAWDAEKNAPSAQGGMVVLDGSFSRDELLALIAMFPVEAE